MKNMLVYFILLSHIVVSETSFDNVSIALLQMLPSSTIEENIVIAERFCREAARKGADIALMPEMWNVGYSFLFPGYHVTDEQPIRDWLQLAQEKSSSYVEYFRNLSIELHMAIGVTYLEKHANGTLPPKNSLTLFDRFGREILHYSKVHTCDWTDIEGLTYPGNQFYVAKLTTTKNLSLQVGVMICYDREQPESARILMLKGAELILVPNACFLDSMRLIQLQVRAFENALVTAMTNYPAPFYNGYSSAYDVDGYLLNMTNQTEGIVMVSFNITRVRQYRTTTIFGDAFRRPQRYEDLIRFEKQSDFQAQNFYRRDRLF